MVSSRRLLVALSAIVLIAAIDHAYIVPAAASNGVAPSVQTDAGISAEADYLSGRTLTTICAGNESAWTQALTAVGLPGSQADRYYGFSLIAQGVMHLSPYVCEGLRLGSVASLRASNVLQVGWAVDVLLHESTHLGRFTRDESLAEACARVRLPAELNRLYQIAYGSREMRSLTLAAAAFRATQDPAYRGGTCTPA